MIKYCLAGTLLMGFGSAWALPLVDLYAGAYLWKPDYSGDLRVQSLGSNLNLDLEKNLKLDAFSDAVLMLGVEHAVPVLPNIQIRHTRLATDSNSLVFQEFEFAGQVFPISSDIKTEIDFTHNDYSLYWGLPVPMMRLQLGLTVHHFLGDVAMSSTALNKKAKKKLNLALPMAYARAEFTIPTTDLQLGAEINGFRYSGSSLIEFDLYANYQFHIAALDLGITGGFRSFNLDIDTKDFGSSKDALPLAISAQGFFFGVSTHL